MASACKQTITYKDRALNPPDYYPNINADVSGKTKDVANLRIHVKRAINRIKTFRILKTVLPITMMHHCDDIILTCSALCNLRNILFSESSKTD